MISDRIGAPAPLIIMRVLRKLSAVLGIISLLALVNVGTSCSHYSVVVPPPTAAQALSASQAAERAAKLANDECWRLFKRRPFEPGQHPAVLENGEYRWGGLDPGGPGGFSALVTFRLDGSEPKVEVYFSTDLL